MPNSSIACVRERHSSARSRRRPSGHAALESPCTGRWFRRGVVRINGHRSFGLGGVCAPQECGVAHIGVRGCTPSLEAPRYRRDLSTRGAGTIAGCFMWCHPCALGTCTRLPPRRPAKGSRSPAFLAGARPAHARTWNAGGGGEPRAAYRRVLVSGRSGCVNATWNGRSRLRRLPVDPHVQRGYQLAEPTVAVGLSAIGKRAPCCLPDASLNGPACRNYPKDCTSEPRHGPCYRDAARPDEAVSSWRYGCPS